MDAPLENPIPSSEATGPLARYAPADGSRSPAAGTLIAGVVRAVRAGSEPALPDPADVTVSDLVAALKLFPEHAENVKRDECTLIEAAMDRGSSWEALGRELGGRSRQAMYQHYRRIGGTRTWATTRTGLEPLLVDRDDLTWRLGPGDEPTYHVSITSRPPETLPEHLPLTRLSSERGPLRHRIACPDELDARLTDLLVSAAGRAISSLAVALDATAAQLPHGVKSLAVGRPGATETDLMERLAYKAGSIQPDDQVPEAIAGLVEVLLTLQGGPTTVVDLGDVLLSALGQAAARIGGPRALFTKALWREDFLRHIVTRRTKYFLTD
ncbi:hypothetical protein [Alloactinosynnema sp. L-07]|uniref:hypothetical protein n=1 Tax=Alloactinosynnema sp. L-07 TaxID=1653480 RepID=UPI0006B600C9|nr:hypothetical protein [Alloactinosynnema sp. L-07]